MPLAAVASLALIGRRDRIVRDLLVVGGVQMPILLTIAPASRNMVNGVIPLAIAGAALMAELWRRSHKVVRLLLTCGAGVALSAQLVLVAFALERFDLMPYLAGREGIGSYLTRTRSFVGPYLWIERSTPPTARILMLGESRSLYLPRQAINGGNDDGQRVAAWLSAFHDVDALGAELRRRGITHVLIGTDNYHVGTVRLGVVEHEAALQLPPPTDALLKALLAQRAVLRYRDPKYLIYEMKVADK